MFNLLQLGPWLPGQVRVCWVASQRRIVPEVEHGTERTWARAASRPGVHLFDGPMCRLESWYLADDGALELSLSPTSYKPFLGTNLHHGRELATQYGRDVLANPVGLSTGLLSRDGFLLMGRRNSAVAYYPDRIHPFAGSLEPRQPLDVFADAQRELSEELALLPEHVTEVRCAGIVEDQTLLQPELIFLAMCTKDRATVEAQLDAAEHHAVWSIPAVADAIARALEDRAAMTPVAVATLLLWGRERFGQAWFVKQMDRVGAS